MHCHLPLILEVKTSDLLYFASDWSNKSKTRVIVCDIFVVRIGRRPHPVRRDSCTHFFIALTRKRQVEKPVLQCQNLFSSTSFIN